MVSALLSLWSGWGFRPGQRHTLKVPLSTLQWPNVPAYRNRVKLRLDAPLALVRTQTITFLSFNSYLRYTCFTSN